MNLPVGNDVSEPSVISKSACSLSDISKDTNVIVSKYKHSNFFHILDLSYSTRPYCFNLPVKKDVSDPDAISKSASISIFCLRSKSYIYII